MRSVPAIEEFLSLSSREDKLRFLVSLASAAPSSHNTQPWIFQVYEEGLELWGNEERMLPASDPDHREFFISLGCALENLVAAAEYFALRPVVQNFPDPAKPLLAARIKLDLGHPVPDGQDHLIFAIGKRHANRANYEARTIPPSFKSLLLSLGTPECEVHLAEEAGLRERIVSIFGEATEQAFKMQSFTKELSHWIKPSLRKYKDGMPGYNIGVPWPISFLLPLAIRHAPLSKKQREMVEESARHTPVFLVLATKEDSPKAWLECGRLAERIWLTAAAQGINMICMAAPIEIGDAPKKLAAALGTPLRPQVFARLGYAAASPESSPRLPIESIFRS